MRVRLGGDAPTPGCRLGTRNPVVNLVERPVGPVILAGEQSANCPLAVVTRDWNFLTAPDRNKVPAQCRVTAWLLSDSGSTPEAAPNTRLSKATRDRGSPHRWGCDPRPHPYGERTARRKERSWQPRRRTPAGPARAIGHPARHQDPHRVYFRRRLRPREGRCAGSRDSANA